MPCDYVISAELIVLHSNLVATNCTIAIKAIDCMLCVLRVNRKVL